MPKKKRPKYAKKGARNMPNTQSQTTNKPSRNVSYLNSQEKRAFSLLVAKEQVHCESYVDYLKFRLGFTNL